MSYLGYMFVIILLTLIPQVLVHSTYNKYLHIKVNNGKTGEEIVKQMLNENGVNDVKIYKIRGILTDHYNSRDKSINLSNDSFMSSSITGVAVATHEVGHAIQDFKGYFFLKLRRSLGPITIVASKLSWIVIYLGFILYFSPFVWLGIFLLGVVVLFDFITLPVEINASKRAKHYLLSKNSFTNEEIKGVNKVLTAATFTYVAATLAGILQIIRLLSIVKDD